MRDQDAITSWRRTCCEAESPKPLCYGSDQISGRRGGTISEYRNNEYEQRVYFQIHLNGTPYYLCAYLPASQVLIFSRSRKSLNRGVDSLPA